MIGWKTNAAILVIILLCDSLWCMPRRSLSKLAELKSLVPAERCVIFTAMVLSNSSSIHPEFYESVRRSGECESSYTVSPTDVLIPVRNHHVHAVRPVNMKYMVRYFMKNESNLCRRSFPDRLNALLSSWTNMPPPIYSNLSYLRSFVNGIAKHNYNVVNMVGDSVAAEIMLFMRLLGFYHNKHNYEHNMLRTRLVDFHPCGLTRRGSTCSPENQSVALSDIINNQNLSTKHENVIDFGSVSNVTTKDPRPLVIALPFGVHVWPVERDIHTSYGVALGLITGAKRLQKQNGTLLIVESPAQHFIYDYNSSLHEHTAAGPSGVYTGPVSHRLKIPGPCCGETVNSAEGNFRNIRLLQELDGIDPHWRSYIGWIPFYDFSQQMPDNKVDNGGDCTHFVVTPFGFNPLYSAMERELVRLNEN